MAEPPLADLLGELPVALAVVDHDGTVRYANAGLGALVGQPDDGLVGRPLDDVLGEPGFLGHLARAAGQGVRELRCRRADGTEMLVNVSSQRLDGTDGLLAVLARSTDGQPDASADAARTATLTELAELPEKNPGPVMRLARDATILMANAAARDFIGQGDIRGLCWLDLCPGMTDEVWQRVLAEAPGSTARVMHEAEKDGVCVLFSHVRSEVGDLVFVYGADITDRRKDERLLAEQAAQLREVARFPEMNPGPVLRLDTGATVLMANAAARDVFGWELIGRCWKDLCPGVDDATFQGFLATESVVPHEARLGDRHFVFAHRYDAHSQLVFVFGADVTAQKLAERALSQSEKMATLGTLAAGVAHELNNPAAATRRAAEQLAEAFRAFDEAQLALGELSGDPGALAAVRELDQWARAGAVRPGSLSTVERSDREVELEEWLDDRGVEDAWELAPTLVAQGIVPEHLERIAGGLGSEALESVLSWSTSAFRVHLLAHEIGQGSARISEIVGALKSYSYLGQAPVQAVDVHEGIDNTLVILQHKLKQGIDVIREYGDVPPVAAYGSELNQVWTNLLDNAADAMDGKGTITIRTSRDGDWAVVEIADDGPGIPEELQQQVFDPFFTTKDPGKGTGLGLSTTYSIVTEKHHGTIRVSSRPGETRFVVRLPLESAEARPPGSPPPGTEGDQP